MPVTRHYVVIVKNAIYVSPITLSRVCDLVAFQIARLLKCSSLNGCVYLTDHFGKPTRTKFIILFVKILMVGEIALCISSCTELYV